MNELVSIKASIYSQERLLLTGNFLVDSTKPQLVWHPSRTSGEEFIENEF